MTENTLLVDDVLSEVRRHKHDIAAQYDFDVVALGRSLQAREATDPRFKEQGGAPNTHPHHASFLVAETPGTRPSTGERG